VKKDHGEDWKFIMWLAINDMVEIEQDGVKLIYRVQKMSGVRNQILFRSHLAATLDDKKQQIEKSPNDLRCRKLNVDPIGNVSYDNDQTYNRRQ
jgi:hypothetical protein